MKLRNLLAIFCSMVVVSATCVAERKFDSSRKPGSKHRALSDEEQLAQDYRARRARGDDATNHGYRPCRDGGRCGYYGWEYGYGWGPGYAGYGSNSSAWSRSYWRGSDLPSSGYHR